MKNFFSSAVGAFFSLSFLFIFVTATLPAHAIETKQEQQAALETFLSELKTHYGMIQFKKENFDISYDKLHAKYTQLIQSAATLEEAAGFWPKSNREVLPPEEFRQLLIGLSAEFLDGHTNGFRQSQNFYTTGIETAAIDGKLYVVGFNPQVYVSGKTTEELKIGDQIVAVDGRSVQDIAKENMMYMSVATHTSRWHKALESILEVPHRMLRKKNEALPVTVEFIRNEAGREQRISGRFPWINLKDVRTLDQVMNSLRPPRSAPIESPYIYGDRGLRSYFRFGMQTANLPRGNVVETGKALNYEIAEKQRLAPQPAAPLAPGAKPPLRPVTHLEAYTVHFKGKTFGVIRIPDYSPEKFEDIDNEFAWLSEIITMFENTTDALIVDQLTNGGGYIYSATQTARILAGNGEFKTGSINIRLSSTYLNNAAQHGLEKEIAGSAENDDGAPANLINFSKVWLSQKLLQSLQQKFEAGQRWSGFIPHMGSTLEMADGHVGRIYKDKNPTYTKPILFLNDNRSASCGDLVPAMLQANKRAVIFGETSMGLGGPVYRSQESMPGSEMFLRCTYGFCLRADQLPIENIGVPADVNRGISVHDLKEGFRTYAIDALESAVLLAEGKPATEIDTALKIKKANALKTFFTEAELAEVTAYQEKIFALQAKEDAFEKLGFEEQAAQLIPVYQQIFVVLQEAQAKLKKPALKQIVFPLPSLLLKQDAILASLTTRASILERLGQMQHLDRYKEKPMSKQLLTQLSQGLAATTPSFYAYSCSDILSGGFSIQVKPEPAKP